jgi:predicted RNA-binding Zn ribbon-like protein
MGYHVTRALPEDRDGFRFRGGSNVLDLAGTRQARLSAAPRELLASPADLGRWLTSAGLASSAPEVSDTDLLAARALREAIFTLAGGRTGRAANVARKTLNEIAAESTAVPELKRDGRVVLTGGAGALLATLAREAVRLFGSEAAKLIRQCEAPNCTLYFLDTSRRGDRRWCSMLACGNRAKVAEFRRRRAKGGSRR